MNDRKTIAEIMKAREKMKTISFQIRPTDYATLKTVFYELGLTTGAGLRFALKEFLRNRVSK